jgi:hypothetical protein
VLLHFQTAHVPRPNVYLYRGVRSEWWVQAVRWVCDGTVAGLVPALGPGVRSLVVPVPNRVSAAKRFDTTSGDVDVSLATFAVALVSG